MKNPVTVRPATPSDAAAIAQIQIDAWRAAYVGIVPQSHLDAMDVAARSAKWEQILSKTDSTTLVLQVHAEVCGWVSVGKSRDADHAQNPNGATQGEIWAIYLAPKVWRNGLGKRLMASAENTLQQMGYGQISLWVLSQNTAGRAFYASLGYVEDVAPPKQFVIDGVTIDEFRMRR